MHEIRLQEQSEGGELSLPALNLPRHFQPHVTRASSAALQRSLFAPPASYEQEQQMFPVCLFVGDRKLWGRNAHNFILSCLWEEQCEENEDPALEC